MSKEVKLLWVSVLFIGLCFCLYATRELQFRKGQTDFNDLVIIRTEQLEDAINELRERTGRMVKILND